MTTPQTTTPETSISAALTSTPPQITPTTFPPNFIDTVEIELLKILNRDYPDMVIDVRKIWLNVYEYKSRTIAPFTNFPTTSPTKNNQWIRKFNHSLTLCDSLIAFFLDSLVLEEEGFGWFSVPDSVDIRFQITALDNRQLHVIYTELAQSLVHAFNQSLKSFWGTVESSGETRRALFLTERVKAIQLEALAGVAQKSLTSQHGAMLEAMLLYAHENSPRALKKHGVFSLSLQIGNYERLHFAGTFVLSHVCELDSPQLEDTHLGPVLLYSPNNGLEGFDSFLLLAQSLSKRLRDSTQNKWFLENAPLAFVAEMEHSIHDASSHFWHFTPMTGDFISSQFLSQITKQQSDFEYCVKLAKVEKLQPDAFLNLITQALKPQYQFDNFLNLDWNDRYILHTSMPNWWQVMSTEDQDSWLISAKTLGHLIIDIEQLTEKYLTNPFSTDQTLAVDYVDTVLNQALKEDNVTLGVDDIYVEVTHTPALLPPYGPRLSLPSSPDNNVVRRYSLRNLGAELPSKLKLANAHSIVVMDAKGTPVKDVKEDFVRTLASRLDNPETIDQFLDERLNSSLHARALSDLSLRLCRTQMRMGLLGAGTANIPQVAQDWIKAVIDAPEAKARRQVNEQNILVKFLAINDVQLSNVLQFAPEDDSAGQGIVFCTFNAPDGVIFRWFKGLDSARTEFLDNPVFSNYLMLQMPIANRPKALRSLQLDKKLQHYRFPDFFKYLPSPIPLPALLWDAITFVEQPANMFEVNHSLKIKHLITDARANLLNAREINTDDYSGSMHLAVSIILLFLPPPVSIPLALGLSLYKAWDGFRAIDEEDYQGAAKEFLVAVDYLAIAGIGRFSLISKANNTFKSFTIFRGRPRPIVRMTGPDGKPHISILSDEPVILPSGDLAGTIPFDAARFDEIKIDGETFYIRTHSNLFGHRQLYRLHAEHPNVLTQRGEFALISHDGHWIKAPYQARGISAKAYRDANIRLTELIADWPSSAQERTPAHIANFAAEYLKLARSNAHSFPEITAYCEGGSAEINSALRAGISTVESTEFLQQFYQLKAYQGLAYRAAYVSRYCLERLQDKVGTIFSDRDIQSASVSPLNAARWANDAFVRQHAAKDKEAIFLIFDNSILKKNMFTGFLGDHVAIAPDTPLQLMAFKNVNNINYAFFSAPERIPKLYLDLFTGQQAAYL